MFIVTEELLELASYSDTEEAQTLMDAVEQGDDVEEALLSKAIALVDRLIELEVVEPEDREALLNADEDAMEAAALYDEAEAENSGDEWDIVATDDTGDLDDDDDADTDDE